MVKTPLSEAVELSFVLSAFGIDSRVNLEWMHLVISGLCNEVVMQHISFFLQGSPCGSGCS